MFHYPASHLTTSYIYAPPHLSSPRDRYFAALVEAKAAEEEYLATEAARREEAQIRRRLAESHYGKQDYLLRSRYDPYMDSYSAYDRLAMLRQQVEEEERLRLLALRGAELEERRRQEQAALELEVTRLRRARAHEEALCRRQEEQREQARLRALVEQSVKVTEHHCSCGNQARPSVCHTQADPAFQHSALDLLRPKAKVTAPVEPKHQVKQGSDLVEALLKQILGISSETLNDKASARVITSKPMASSPKLKAAQEMTSNPSAAQDDNVVVPQKYFERLFKSMGISFDQRQQPASQTTPSSKGAAFDEALETQLLQEFAKLLVPLTVEVNKSPASSLFSNSTPDAPEKTAPASSAPAPVAPKAQTSDISTPSLKGQLEARLNNEFDSEVRDTIQAIFESLRDTDNHENSTSTTSSDKGKGKAKDDESSSTTTSNPTSTSVVDSLNQVRNIETAFRTLEADFSFPATLDFIASHLLPDRLTSSTRHSSSAITHLAYTWRNQPVRFYDQALTAFLTQLDSIDSFGNDNLRATRKRVVSRIEKALEELEDEIDSRYMARLLVAKEAAKSVPIEVTTAAPEVVTNTTSVVPEPKIKDSEESASAITVPSEPGLTATSAEEPSLESSKPSSPNPITPAEPADIPTVVEETSSLSSSSATVKGYEVQTEDITPVEVSPSVETQSTDAFLLTTEPETIPKRPNNKDKDDVASDWSEVEA